MTTKRMTADEHAVLLRDFFTKFYEPRETVYIFPGLSEEKHEEFKSKVWELGKPVQKRDLRYMNPDKGEFFLPRRILNPFSRKASSINAKLIGKLNEFVDLGYDIYFAVNPQTCAKRCQKTIFEVRHIVLEADSADLELQKKIFNEYREYFSAMIFSGSRSIHAYARISPAIPNYQCVGWRKARELGKNTSVDLPEYTDLANQWINTMRQRGLQLDVKVARDFSRVSRVPGFKHSKTGRESEVIFFNDSPFGSHESPSSQDLFKSEQWDSDYAPIISEIIDSDMSHEVKEVNDANEVNEANEARDVNLTNLTNLIDLTEVLDLTDLMDSTDSTPRLDNSNPNVILDGSMDSIVSPVSCNNPKSIKSPIRFNTSPNNSQRLNDNQERREVAPETNSIHNQSFIDHLRTYEGLKREGIPCRGKRKSYHVALYVSGRILGWDRERLVNEWKNIVTLKPENIGVSPELAIEQFLELYDSKKNNSKISLPNTMSLPEDPISKTKLLIASLKAHGCQYPKSTANIILKLLWRSIRELPVQCQDKTLGIKAADLQRFGGRRYQAILRWMDGENILKVTDPSYFAGKKTRRYSINILWVLYLMGFQTEELEWSKPSKQARGAKLSKVGADDRLRKVS